MAVRRIVPNVAADRIDAANAFYGNALGMQVVMNLGWIVTFAAVGDMSPQISVATEGGSGTPVPDVSIEVDDVSDVHRRMQRSGFDIKYGPVIELWGVKRFYVRDPFGRLVNIVEHCLAAQPASTVPGTRRSPDRRHPSVNRLRGDPQATCKLDAEALPSSCPQICLTLSDCLFFHRG